MARQKNKDRDAPLTIEQRDFAEANHDTLVYCMRSLRMTDDRYDTAALGYLAAVRDWFSNGDPHASGCGRHTQPGQHGSH